MSESSNKLNLRALILYDIYDWKTAGGSYENYKKICRKIGNITEIGFEEYENKFMEYTKERLKAISSGRTLSEISDVCLCILSDVLRGRTLEEVDQNLRDALGTNSFVYGDLDFWYYQFYHGNMDMDYDRSIEPKRLEFSELPLEIIKELTDNLSWKSQLRLRKVSRELQELVDQKRPPYKSILVYVDTNHIVVSFGGVQIFYSASHNSFRGGYEVVNGHIKDDDYTKTAFSDLAFALKNPKLHLEVFDITVINPSKHYRCEDSEMVDFNEKMNTINSIFKGLPHKISVDSANFSLDTQDVTASVMSSFKPHTFRDVSFSFGEYNSHNMDEITKLDQWKGLEECYFFADAAATKIEHFFYMKKFTIEMPSSFSIQDLVKLKENCSKSTNFTICDLIFNEHADVNTIVAGLNLTPHFMDENEGNIITFQPYIWPIPDSEDVLQFLIEAHSITIHRKKNNTVNN